METQKIVNLLNVTDNESLKFAIRKWCFINDQKKTDNMVKGMKIIQVLNLRQKLLKQVFVIIQVHIYL